MRTLIVVAVLGVLFPAFITPPASAVTVPMTDSTYSLMDDMVTFNWKILAQKYPTVEVPALPTGNIPFLRIYSNGDPSNSTLPDPVKWQNDKVGGLYGDFNAAQSANLWYGLEYEKGHGHDPDTVARVLTGGEILSLIQGIDPGSTTPVFAFDQNQTPNTGSNSPLPDGWGTTPALARDIWIRARMILVKPDAVDPVDGLDALLGLEAYEVNNIIDPLIAANDPGVVVFNLSDTIFLDFPGSPNWVYLPGIYQTEGFTADNNGDAARGDWGGFSPSLDLTQYTDYGMFIEVQTLFDNNGQEEVYIIGGMNADVIPEPVTLFAVLAGVAGLGAYIRRRRAE